MANFSKAFNFRGGFQVDTDVLLVRGQNVGIGSTIPNERLVVDGIIQANGLKISSSEAVGIETANVGFLSATLIHSGVTSISNGIITATNPTGVVTYYGDGGRLLNLPTSQWLDVDVGLGFTSIYAQGNVGVDTSDPRFVFQVGGVPYPKDFLNVFQEGVGIETGNIWASGDYTSRGNISIGQTATAAQFVGMGSGITALNASNLGVGSIPSNIYGDEIYTGTVYGDLVGTATTAASVVGSADLVFDTALARILQATQRIFTPEGKIQVGTDNANNVGEIDVRRATGNSRIYSISDSGSAQIFAASQRPGGSNISYGGIRFGGNVPNAPESRNTDLDLVNYDVGNLNYYLHGSTSGTTEGKFQWIYGRIGNRILADLDRYGEFRLVGHSTATQPTFNVSGISTLNGDVYVDGNLEVTQNSTFRGNLDVEGDLTLTGSIGITTDSLELPATTFAGKVIVGDDPAAGGGVELNTGGLLRANEIEVMNGPNTSFSVTQAGTIDAQGIGCTGLFSEFIVQTQRVDAEDYSGANGFRNDASGANFTNLEVDNIFRATTGEFTSLSASSFDINTLIATSASISGISLTNASGNFVVGAPIQTTEIIANTWNVGGGIKITVGVTSDTLVFNIDNNGTGNSVTLPFNVPVNLP